MKKKVLSLILASAMVMSLVACGSSEAPAETTPAADSVATETKTETEAPADTAAVTVEGKIALVTDVGTIDDESFNQASWEGVVQYGDANGIEYTYYQPTEDSTEERINQIDLAVSEGASVVVLPGYLFGETLSEVQTTYPDVKFIALDVSEFDMTADRKSVV